MSLALEEPKQQPAAEQGKLYKQGCGEGLLMFWCLILIAASIIGGVFVATIAVEVPRYPGLPGMSDYVDNVPIYGAAGGIAFAFGGFCTASLFYGLSKAIALLKMIAAQADSSQAGQSQSATAPGPYNSPMG